MTLRLDRLAFALPLIGLGVLAFIYGDFALQWQPVPAWVPARAALAYATGVVMIATGVGLLFARSAALATRVLFVYLLIWFLLKVPPLFTAPLFEANWLGDGELAMLVAAGWVLFASSTGRRDDRAMKAVRFLFGFSLLPIGLSHFFYLQPTVGFVPSWLPFRTFWAYLGGAGHIAAGLGVIFGVVPRLAATLEAAMIGIFTALVWLPGVIAAPTNRLQWTAMFMSWIIAASAWVVAGGLSTTKPVGDDLAVKVPPGASISPPTTAVRQP